LNFEVWGLHGNVSIRKAFTSECTTLESDFIVEVPVATPTMQAGKGSWMGLFTRRANCGVVFVTRLPDKKYKRLVPCPSQLCLIELRMNKALHYM